MPDNRRVQRNGSVADSSSNPDVNKIEEAVRRLRIQTDGKQDECDYPDRPNEPDCIFYLRTGKCGYGNNCRFNHPTHPHQANHHGNELPERAGEPDCMYYLKTGTCKYGSTCKYNHPHDRRGAGPVMMNMLGLPMRQEEKACPHYIRTGSCKFGVSCKFDHPQPSADGRGVPYASTLVPSSGLSPWSYVSDPQTYLPVLLPPSQGWTTYMGSLGPVTSASLFGGSGSIDRAYTLTSGSNLPDRPGEPECRYFMNTGDCKYGPDCKYHHPKDKSASSLGPLGLPLRPGHTVCSYYSLYGMCKFGPACKYDHPLMGYSYTYGTPVMDPSMFAYGGTNTHRSSVFSLSKSSKNAGRAKTTEDSHSRSTSPQHEHKHEHEYENGASPSHSE